MNTTRARAKLIALVAVAAGAVCVAFLSFQQSGLRPSSAGEATALRPPPRMPIQIDGRMSVEAVEDIYGVSSQAILNHLRLPADTDTSQSLADLLPISGFEIESVRDFVRVRLSEGAGPPDGAAESETRPHQSGPDADAGG